MLTYEQLRDDPAVRKQFNEFDLNEKRFMFGEMQAPQGMSESDLREVQKGIMMKTSEADSQVPLQRGTTTNDIPLAWSQVPAQALSNLDDSAIEYGKNLWQAMRHPIETGQQLFGLMAGAVEKAIPGGEDKHVEIVNNTIDFFKERYGGSNFGEVMENIKQTMATDPVGFLSDLSVVVTGGGFAAAKAAQVGGKLATVAKVASVPKAANVINTANKLRNITSKFDALDPATLAVKGATKGASKVVQGFATRRNVNRAFNDTVQQVFGVEGDLASNEAFAKAAIERGVNITEADMVKFGRNRNKLGKAIETTLKKADQEAGQLTHIDELLKAFDDVLDDTSRFQIEGFNEADFITKIKKAREKFAAGKDTQLSAVDLNKISKGIKFEPEIGNKYAAPANQVNQQIKSVISNILGDLFPETVDSKKFGEKFTKKRVKGDFAETVPIGENVLEEFGWKAVTKEFGIQKEINEAIKRDLNRVRSKGTGGNKGLIVGGASNVVVGLGAGAAGFGAAGIPGAIGFTVAAFYISKMFDNPTLKLKFARKLAKTRNIRISVAKKLVDQRITDYMAELQKQAQQAGRNANIQEEQ